MYVIEALPHLPSLTKFKSYFFSAGHCQPEYRASEHHQAVQPSLHHGDGGHRGQGPRCRGGRGAGSCQGQVCRFWRF